MSFEINIIALGQELPVEFPQLKTVIVKNEIDNQEIGRYAEIWPFFSMAKGILYSLGCYGKHSFFSALEICDSDFETSLSGEDFPYWLSAQDKSDLTPVIIKNSSVQQEIAEIIELLLNESPQKNLLFQTRYQGGDKEVIFGTIQFQDFLAMLEQKRVLFNVCYILSKA